METTTWHSPITPRWPRR